MNSSMEQINQLIRDIRARMETKMRQVLDTADEIERLTGKRPDVRAMFEAERAKRGEPPMSDRLPHWFK